MPRTWRIPGGGGPARPVVPGKIAAARRGGRRPGEDGGGGLGAGEWRSVSRLTTVLAALLRSIGGGGSLLHGCWFFAAVDAAMHGQDKRGPRPRFVRPCTRVKSVFLRYMEHIHRGKWDCLRQKEFLAWAGSLIQHCAYKVYTTCSSPTLIRVKIK
jgi:hypothetical protein